GLRSKYAQHPIRYGFRPVRAIPARRGAAGGRARVQTPPGWLFARDRRRVVGSDLRLQYRLVFPREIQPCAFDHRELHIDPVAAAGASGWRQHLSLSDPQNAAEKYPGMAERWRGGPGEQSRELADA